jgi:hypothetical protein
VDAWEEVQVALHVPTFAGDIRSPCELHAQSLGVLGVPCEQCVHRPRSFNRFLLAAPPASVSASGTEPSPGAFDSLYTVPLLALDVPSPTQWRPKALWLG